jgi:hypothetical protein
MEFIKENWAVIATVLFAISELLALVPAIKSNSILQAIVNGMKSLFAPKQA